MSETANRGASGSGLAKATTALPQVGQAMASFIEGGGLSSDPTEREKQARAMNWILDDLFLRKLSAAEQVSYHAESWTDSMVDRYDELVIEQAAVYGTAIMLSPAVQQRYLRWPHLTDAEKGISHIKRFNDATLLQARIARGKAKGKIKDPNIRVFKPHVVAELRRIMRAWKDATKQSRTQMSEWLCETVKRAPQSYPRLSMNLASIKGYLRQLAESDPARARRLITGRITPEDFFTGWFGWSKGGLSDNTVRIRIAELGRKTS